MKLSIPQRMMIGVGAVSVLSLMALVGGASWAMREMSRALVDERMEAIVTVSSIALTNALIADDIATIDSLIDQVLSHENGAVRMCVFDQKDRRLSTGRCFQIEDKPMPGDTVKEAPVIVAGNGFGYVGIAYNARKLVPPLYAIERRLFLIAAGCLGLSLMIAYVLGRELSVEICAMRVALRGMASNGGPRPLRKTEAKELQQVADAFNDLLSMMGEKK